MNVPTQPLLGDAVARQKSLQETAPISPALSRASKREEATAVGPYLQAPGDSSLIPLTLPATLGRGRGNQVSLADPTVSVLHARVYFDEALNAICIEDLHSLNGLLINNQPTIKNVLFDGVKITLGSTHLLFRDGEAQPLFRRSLS